MRFSWLTQLGFDFGMANDAPAPPASVVPQLHSEASPKAITAPSGVPIQVAVSPPHDVSVPSLREQFLFIDDAVPAVSPVPRDKPSRGRSATRARTAVLFARLEQLGLRGVDALVLMRTRTVMVSLIGRTLRVHEGFADAPEATLRAIVSFAMARTKAARTDARNAILQFEIERAPAPRRVEPPRPGDLALIAQLCEAHRQLNAQHFEGMLTDVPIRLSGRMATRLAHYDPGSKHVAAEIVMSRKHVVKHGWREAMHTLLHEMVHQWQHETNAPIDHGAGFRKKAREVGITPAARRDVMPLERRRRAVG